MDKSWSKQTQKVNDEVMEVYDKACEIAVNEVERLARKILREHPRYEEFIMTMGTCFFTTKDGYTVDMLTQQMNSSFEYYYELTYKYFEPLHSFIYEWNDYLKITGHTMRLTANGLKITE